jgi:hypothetical protein
MSLNLDVVLLDLWPLAVFKYSLNGVETYGCGSSGPLAPHSPYDTAGLLNQ